VSGQCVLHKANYQQQAARDHKQVGCSSARDKARLQLTQLMLGKKLIHSQRNSGFKQPLSTLNMN